MWGWRAEQVQGGDGIGMGMRVGFGVGMGVGFGLRMEPGCPSPPPCCPCAQGGDRRVLPVHEPAEPARRPSLHDAQPLHGPGQATGDSALPQPPEPLQRDLPVHPRLPPLLQRERRAREPWGAGGGSAGAASPGESEVGNAAGKTPVRSPRGAAPPLGISTSPVGAGAALLHPRGAGGQGWGSRPRWHSVPPGATRFCACRRRRS